MGCGGSKAPPLTEEQQLALRLQNAMLWDDSAAADRLFRFIDAGLSHALTYNRWRRGPW